MTASSSHFPIQVARRKNDDNIIDGDLGESSSFAEHAKEFAGAFLSDLAHEMREKDQSQTSSSSTMPGMPSSAGGQGNPYETVFGPGVATASSNKRLARTTIIIVGAPSGIFIMSHLTRKGMIVVIVVLALIFWGFFQFPGLWDLIFSLI
ncbi:MAG TPA: hypothetical protein VHP83_20605 [Aggregatilineaceae bacterium]|nr:hypothetical protein [Aggregatilineaceae bacterium]